MAEKNTSSEQSTEIDIKETEFIDPLIDSSIVIDNEQTVNPVPTTLQHFLGIIYSLSSAFLFTVSIFIPKQLNVELIDALIPRFVIQTIMLFIYIKLIKRYSLYRQATKQERFLLLIYIFFFTSGFITFFIGTRYLPLPDITTIRYTQVIWTAIIISILYREKPSIPIILAVLLTILGVIFVAQPKFLFEKTSIFIKNQSSIDYRNHWLGFIIAFYASIAVSTGVVSNKYLLTKYQIKQSLLLFNYCLTSTSVLIVYLIIKYYPSIDKIQSIKNDFFHWKYFCASFVCLLQIVSSILGQKAIKREHPSVFTIVQASEILFSIILQNIFASIKSNLLSLFGSILVLTSILIISGYKLISEKKKREQS